MLVPALVALVCVVLVLVVVCFPSRWAERD
jgi:hypothetical protein